MWMELILNRLRKEKREFMSRAMGHLSWYGFVRYLSIYMRMWYFTYVESCFDFEPLEPVNTNEL